VLHIHPFAEEVNKGRRMTSLLARALAEDGWAVMQIDLLGCGDSSGEFGEADWNQWLDDVRAAHRWLRSKYQGMDWLWGLRAGCLLAVEALPRLEESPNLLFWQPVYSGRQHLTQFLRLQLANEMLGGAAERSGVQGLRQRLLAGESLEIAGYELSPGLALPLERAELTLQQTYQGKILWLETSHDERGSLTPGSVTRITRLQEQGLRVQASAVTGSLFWQSVEISECPALLEETLGLMRQETA
jgi:exosortase A-associated hydrolase 2